jgi:hypothetical protein
VSAFDDLDHARHQLGWSVETLWLAYAGLGGSASLRKVGEFLRTGSGLTARQYDYLAQALNDCFVENGQDHPVPYSETMNAELFDAG